MDVKHKDMQFLGTFEIFKETYKIINKNKKLFAWAALCFIHPLNYILSSFLGTLNLLLRNLHEYGNMSHLFSHTWPYFWSFKVFCIIFLFGCTIFSTAGVSHTVAAVYTGREPSVKDTRSIVAKVWKRVLITFLCVVLVLLAYHIIVAGFGLLLFFLIDGNNGTTTLAVFLVFYFVGLLYLAVVLQLAGVVSALEESCGFKAMARSRVLLKGKTASATVVVLAIWLSFGTFLWLDAVVRNMIFSPSWITWRIIMWMHPLASLLLLFLILVFLLWKLVLETMLYFVCKSYHHESVDMLSTLLDEDQTPLRSSEC